MNMKKCVKVELDTLIVICNRNIDEIDEEREELYINEKEKLKNFFGYNDTLAESYINKIYPSNNIIFKHKQDIYLKSEFYLNKALNLLESDNDGIVFYIPEEDFVLLN